MRSWLVMRGFLNIGCLSSSALMVDSILHMPCFMLSQAPIMLFHNEHGSLLSLGAAKSQLMSWVLGPMPWTGSLIWLALCLKSSFQGSPPGARPLIRNFASRAFDWVLGFMIPRPALVVGRAKVSHLTLALAFESFPPHMKFRTTPRTWLHILGFEFHHTAKYHMEARRT